MGESILFWETETREPETGDFWQDLNLDQLLQNLEGKAGTALEQIWRLPVLPADRERRLDVFRDLAQPELLALVRAFSACVGETDYFNLSVSVQSLPVFPQIFS